MCCSDENFCNMKLSPMYEYNPNDNSEDTSLDDYPFPTSDAATIALLVTFAIGVVILIFVVTCVYLR